MLVYFIQIRCTKVDVSASESDKGKAVFRSLKAIVVLVAVAGGLLAQQPGQDQPPKPGNSGSDQAIPDAPSAVRPPQSFPASPPTSHQDQPQATEPPPPPPASQAPPRQDSSASSQPVEAQPPLRVTTVPQGGATPGEPGSQEQLFTLSRNVNQVIVPVMVKDDSGRLVSGLFPRDFSVFEDGKKVTLNFFTSDPSALSAAIVFDTGMPDVAVQKVIQTLPALEGAFSQFDEVSIYTFSSSFSKVQDFATVGRQLEATLNRLKNVTGRNNGPPVTGGPLGPQGPMVNGRPIQGGPAVVITPAKESHVLNDAVLAAALDLAKRERTRRKVIFVISDGREFRSNASYRDTLRVLLSNNVLLYGVSVENSAIPVYNKLERLHLPRYGYSNILPKYANATGGEIITGFSRDAIESTYAKVLGDARNQYTLGYVTRATPSSAYRQIEVVVARPDVKVTSKDGYYPAAAK